MMYMTFKYFLLHKLMVCNWTWNTNDHAFIDAY
jgi:hypothetical protein